MRLRGEFVRRTVRLAPNAGSLLPVRIALLLLFTALFWSKKVIPIIGQHAARVKLAQ